MPANADRLAEIRRHLNAWLSPIGLSPDCRSDIVLVVNEAATNCIEHAYRGVDPGLIKVEAHDNGGEIVVDVVDSGRWHTPPTHAGTRGKGLLIIRAVSDGVELDASPDGTTVRMSFRVALQGCGSRTT